MYVIKVSEREKKEYETEQVFKEIIVNLQYLAKDENLQIKKPRKPLTK